MLKNFYASFKAKIRFFVKPISANLHSYDPLLFWQYGQLITHAGQENTSLIRPIFLKPLSYSPLPFSADWQTFYACRTEKTFSHSSDGKLITHAGQENTSLIRPIFFEPLSYSPLPFRRTGKLFTHAGQENILPFVRQENVAKVFATKDE